MGLDLANFGLTETLRTSRELHRVSMNAPTMESAARAICRWLYENLSAADGGRASVLVRCYKTHPFGSLPNDLQRFARRAGEFAAAPDPQMKCLTLLASSGDLPAWNGREASRGHQAIPLPSERFVERAPMIAQLVGDFGLRLADVVNPTPEVVRDLAGRSYGVFHVEEARGSVAIPAQDDFVVKHGVRSAVGFGGSLASGDLFAVIIFSRVPVPAAAAERFRTVALDVKSAFFPYGATQIFDVPQGAERPGSAIRPASA